MKRKTTFKDGESVRCASSYGSSYTKGETYIVKDTYFDGAGNERIHTVSDNYGSTTNGWGVDKFEAIKQEATVLGTQVGGSHYTDCAIQPIEYIWANKLGFSEGNIVKYVTRYKAKGGIKDLEKAHHHLALLIERMKKDEAK